MKRAHHLKKRLATLETLREAVSAMKNLSAHHFREMRGAVAPAAEYRRGVEDIAGRVGASLPAGTGPAALLLVAGELGLCGAYNSRLTHAFVQRHAELGPTVCYCIGQRGARMAQRLGIAIERTYSAPSSASGFPTLLLQLTQDLLRDYQQRRLSRIEVVSSAYEGIGALRPKVTPLLPLRYDAQSVFECPPYVSVERTALVAARETLYCTIYDLLIEAFATEHGARLLATQAAEQWLDRAATQLRSRLAAASREASTQEVIEIGAGVRARTPSI